MHADPKNAEESYFKTQSILKLFIQAFSGFHTKSAKYAKFYKKMAHVSLFLKNDFADFADFV
jgi:hypothetical protein